MRNKWRDGKNRKKIGNEKKEEKNIEKTGKHKRLREKLKEGENTTKSEFRRIEGKEIANKMCKSVP